MVRHDHHDHEPRLEAWPNHEDLPLSCCPFRLQRVLCCAQFFSNEPPELVVSLAHRGTLLQDFLCGTQRSLNRYRRTRGIYASLTGGVNSTGRGTLVGSRFGVSKLSFGYRVKQASMRQQRRCFPVAPLVWVLGSVPFFATSILFCSAIRTCPTANEHNMPEVASLIQRFAGELDATEGDLLDLACGSGQNG